jgi:rhamnulokinase
MSQARNYLAIDLGAESGRTIVGSLADGKLTLSETYRFQNGPVPLNDGLHWDVLRLWSDIKDGISKSNPMDSIGLDSWAVDFALLDKNGSMLGNPFHYRDARTDGMLEEAFKVMPRAEIFANSGIQFMQLNTLYQLIATTRNNPSLFDVAKTFVTIPDLFNYWLTGELTNEFTNATTTQCFDPRTRDWSTKIMEAFDIPTHLFKPVADPGTIIGTLSDASAVDPILAKHPLKVSVVLPACHDTGSAVVAVPARNEDFAWLSSGTWSIMGAEVREPCLNEKALEYNFTNEGGVFGTWRLSRNVMGLWLMQECRREWMRKGEDLPFDALTQAAAESEAFLSVIDPDFDAFLHLGDMPSRIQKFCVDTNQRVPQTKGQIVRVALEGISLKYRLVLERLEALTGRRLDPLHIIGGGAKNHLLNQFTADSTGRTVITGPVEATAIGNILMQAIGMKHLGSLAEARDVVRASFEPEVYEPQHTADWDAAYSRLLKVIS